jgi:hypothetical protein
MARSRKMPPLFEVMRETDRKAEEAAHAPAATPVGPRPAEPSARHTAPSAKLRISPAAGLPSRVAESAHAEEASERTESPGQGLLLPWPVLLGGVGVLIAVVAVIAMLAFNAGAKREQEQLLPKDGEPPVVGRPANPREPQPADPLRESGARRAGETPAAPRTDAARAALPVYGEDPRESGKNYLIIERLMFDDAMAAAEFLTANGVPSVVVAPEGTEVSDLQQQPRAIWLVVARDGFTRDEFRADSARAEEIKNSVIRLGRRWKQDHKGSTNFANCYWNKFGK